MLYCVDSTPGSFFFFSSGQKQTVTFGSALAESFPQISLLHYLASSEISVFEIHEDQFLVSSSDSLVASSVFHRPMSILMAVDTAPSIYCN